MRYGVDAPGVIRGLIACGLAAIGAGVGVLAIWSAWLAVVVAAVPLIAGLILTGLGSSMIVYAWRGKLRMRDEMLGCVDWTGHEQVLDIGTGRGLLAVGAAKRLTGGHVRGIDIWRVGDLSRNTIAETHRLLAAEGVVDRVTIESADACDLIHTPAGTTDVVLSLLCLHNIEDAARRREAFRGIAHVCRPGAVVVLADFTGVADYARWLAEDGLIIRRHGWVRRAALSPMKLVVAVKPVFRATPDGDQLVACGSSAG